MSLVGSLNRQEGHGSQIDSEFDVYYNMTWTGHPCILELADSLLRDKW